MSTEFVRNGAIVIREPNSNWVKVIAILAICTALFFCYLWAYNNPVGGNSDVEEESKSGKKIRNANKNKRAKKQVTLPPEDDEDSEDDLIIDPDLQGGPQYTQGNPMMHGYDMPPMGSTGNFPMDTGGPPPPIKVGRNNDNDGGFGGGGFGGGDGSGGGGGDGGPRAYGGRRRKGVSIRF